MREEGHYLEKELERLIQTDSSIFRFIQESSLDGMWYWDLENPEHEWMSPKFWETLGYNHSKMPHKISAWQNIIFQEDLKQAEVNVGKHLSDAEFPYDQVVRYQHQDGSTVWIRCRGLAIRNSEGKPIRFLGAHTDITKLKEKELELQSFLDDAHDLIQSVDEDGNFVYVNKSWCKTMEYDEHKAYQMKIFDIIHPDYKAHCKQALQQLIGNQVQISTQVIFLSASGKHIYLEGNISRYRQSQGKIVTRGIFRDITERHIAELELTKTKEMLEQTNKVAKVGGWELSPAENKVYWTQVTKEIHEVEELFEPDINTCINFYKHGTSREKIEEVVKLAIEEGKPFDVELEIVTAKGNQRWVKAIGRTEQKNGKTVRVYGTFQNIHAQKINQQKLEKATANAKAASTAKSEFLANMSHEIRTPLNGVIGFSDLLMKTQLDKHQHDYMKAVQTSANALLELINDILDFSKIEAGKLELEEEKFNLRDHLENTCAIVRHKIDEKALKFVINLDKKLPQFVWTDPTRLRQIIVNLLSNASKFTQEGEIELAVKPIFSNKIKDRCQIEFAVKDTGIGIPFNKQKLIFQAFSQEDASTTRKFGGTGLGLSISNQLLGMMGSTLKLNSKTGIGSTFSFTLDVNFENQDLQLKKDKKIKKALIVNSQKKDRLTLQNMLSLLEIQTETAQHGLDALHKIKSNHYDLLLIEYHMPYLNGIQVVQEIRNTLKISNENLPVILLNRKTNFEVSESLPSSSTFCRVLNFPFSLEEISENIDQLDSILEHNINKVEIESTIPYQGLKILIVDDNAMNRSLATILIQNILPEAEIIEAKDGAKAINTFKEQKPDIIFMDIQMPNMSGYEASRKIRQLEGNHHTVILALTAGTVKGEEERCLKAGMDDYLSKPILLDVLQKKLLPWVKKLHVMNDEEKVNYEALNLHFDFNQCKTNLAVNDEAVLGKLVIDLIKHLETELPILGQALLQQDIKKIRAISHKHKASTKMLSMSLLSEQFTLLEASEEQPFSNIESLVQQITQEFEQVKMLAKNILIDLSVK